MKQVTLEHLEPLDFRIQEAYKTLRGNIGFCGADIKTIAVTSTVPNEGKTNVSLHLAISMAEAGYKVCFIDADLRKSVIVGKYRVGQVKAGLTNYLSGQEVWEECVCETEYENLHIVFAGPVPPNPSELVGGALFYEKLNALKEEYDYIIIDTPPLGSVIDGAIIAAVCDGAFIVIESDRMSYRHIRKTKDQLARSGCRILGAVLNKVDMSAGSYYGKYYGNYYGKETAKVENKK